ncbi:PP2C family protein-serine/threonine phosphatase [Euzebya sp.]|uniref:PP2C family protein-serine/threonine phosphatase n=1 Tax=Euzebya sp. TaxID=1971409 RepID=UPI003516C081
MPDPSAEVRDLDLAALAARLAAIVDADRLLGVLLDHAAEVTGATGAAVLERSALDGLVRIADRDSSLGEQLSIGDVRASLWGVLLGRTQLRWSRRDDAPRPFREVERWDRGAVVRIASRRGPTKLLAVGGPDLDEDVDLRHLQAMADIAAPSIESLELASASRRSQALLRGVTELAGNLGAAVSPTQLLEAITSGLVRLDGIAGARVWAAADVQDPSPVVVAGVEEGARLSGRSIEGRVRRLLDPRTGPAVRSLVESPARIEPDGPLVTLMALSTDPPRALGILHHQPLDELSQGVLASLVTASGPAMREVEMAAERRTLLSGYTRALRPSTRPEGVELAVEHHPNTSAPGSFGGDFYDWFTAGEDQAIVALGDVSGKGINAASAASMVVWSLRAIGGRGAHPTVISHLLNGVVARELDVDRFVTLALLAVDTTTWESQLLLAGHPSPLLVAGGDVTVVESSPAPPLGVDAVNSAAPPVVFALDRGQALVLFTDGVTDATDATGERYGIDRLRARAERLTAVPTWSAKTLAAGLWHSVHAWAGGPPDDDCAILVVRRPE